MTIKEILDKRQELEMKLNFALSTMERKDDIKNIYKEIKENQANCPHDLQFSINENNECIYCGKKRGDN